MAEQNQQIETRVRLTQQEFERLENQCLKLYVPSTELEAGWQLGVQDVLTKLRKGWVIG